MRNIWTLIGYMIDGFRKTAPCLSKGWSKNSNSDKSVSRCQILKVICQSCHFRFSILQPNVATSIFFISDVLFTKCDRLKSSKLLHVKFFVTPNTLPTFPHTQNIVMWHNTFKNTAIHFSDYCSKILHFPEPKNQQILSNIFHKEYFWPLKLDDNTLWWRQNIQVLDRIKHA